jgi:hypothetical protein
MQPGLPERRGAKETTMSHAWLKGIALYLASVGFAVVIAVSAS